MKKLILLLLLIFMALLQAKIETNGDKSLKNQKIIFNDFYIGIAESQNNFEQAYQKALSNAISAIIQDLGVNVSLYSIDKFISVENQYSGNETSLLNREITIEGEHNISTKISKIYTEKDTKKNSYKIWIELYFNKENYLNHFRGFWINEINLLKKNNYEMLNADYVNNLHRILQNKEKFDKEMTYLTVSIMNEYIELCKQYQNIFYRHKQNIAVQNIAENQKFSKNFVFKLTDISTNKLLANFPIIINNKFFTTNEQGLCEFVADYENDITILLGHNLECFFTQDALTIYKNDYFSPRITKNVAINVKSTQKTLEKNFIKLFESRGYIISSECDILIEIQPTYKTSQPSVNTFLTELTLTLNFNKNKKTLSTMNIPTNKNTVIKGQGNTKENSLISAFSLEYYTQKENDFKAIEKRISSLLEEK